ncbi:tRNA (guanine-N(7)-)-methyltransferase [Candidatus Erwinia haradaeae]|uniref:tRNA (guanine-N(7)-)-methyltransferase n=1 Tax=Candidatus Erwinia haradaeae TaxID=1922217 RepID=A0A451DC61_9GAMM|nr:tRNA (guanosine(46)-N7)-methyltransferase TrmB [Candidatus Erwinia haradaeae]VFP84012.1 tRNA (guanine-N(7)-)-methyltransferase [Candidatus Erwinia haradaeae]
MVNHNVTQYVYKKDCPIHRILSFIPRQGRCTPGQKKALERLWPVMGVEYQRQLIDFTYLFGRLAPIVLEIGFGMGSSLVNMAAASSNRNFFGIEVYKPGVGACLLKAQEAKVNNLRIAYYDAVEILDHMVPLDSLHTIQIFFPDPWPKTRHHKRRIIQKPFAQLVLKKLKLGGILHIATDWEDYAHHMLMVMSSIDGYQNQSINNTWIPRPEFRPYTKFEKKGELCGHGIWDLMFQRVK